jgi:hypothetical protein
MERVGNTCENGKGASAGGGGREGVEGPGLGRWELRES